MPTLLPGAVYGRVSTVRQKNERTIDSQLADLPKLLERAGYQAVGFYADDGISGSSIMNRPDFNRLLDDVEDGLYRAVAMDAIDRSSRSGLGADWDLIKTIFLKGRCKLITVSQVFDFNNDEDVFMGDLHQILSAREKRLILRRTTRGKRFEMAKGKHHGGPRPFGWDVDPTTKMLLKNDDDARIITSIYDWYLSGDSINIISRLGDGVLRTQRTEQRWETVGVVHGGENPQTETVHRRVGAVEMDREEGTATSRRPYCGASPPYCPAR